MKKNRPANGRKLSLVEKVVQYLTREILSDRLRPNQRISEPAISKQLGVSRSPVREALRILERDGLVKQSDNRGMVVADVTPEEADELYLIHGHLIGLAVRLACQRMKGEDLTGMRDMVRKLRQAADNDDRNAFLDIRTQLERFVGERSFSPRLAHLLEVMAYPSARYRAFHVSVPGYMDEITGCYEGIYEAFSKRDDTAAEQLRLKIMDRGRELLRRYFIEPYAGMRNQERSDERL
jgi:DNA-binding GntR family transcriptional regulator